MLSTIGSTLGAAAVDRGTGPVGSEIPRRR
jgi:hypothetical protein